MAGMGLVSWVVFGLLAGALARWILPGKDPSGCLVTVALGIAGALLGGLLATYLGFGGISGFDWRSLAVAIAGSLLLLCLWRFLRGK